MKSRPILFGAPMVRALLTGTKTHTRRIAKTEIVLGREALICSRGKSRYAPTFLLPDAAELAVVHCPYGQPGDQLNVRETTFAWGRWETRFSAEKSRDEWHFVDMTLESGRKYLFSADNENYKATLGANQGRGLYPGWWKRPAIFMPQAISRITLEITGVRLERLQDISEADAIAEGIERGVGFPGWYRHSLPGDSPGLTELGKKGKCPTAFPRLAYRALWESINGPGSWELNPWVWVIEFRRLP